MLAADKAVCKALRKAAEEEVAAWKLAYGDKDCFLIDITNLNWLILPYER